MSIGEKKFSLSTAGKWLALVAIVFVCLAPGRYDQAMLGWLSAFKTTPAQKCADPTIVDQLTSNIRASAVRSEKLFSDKPSSSSGSNGSYAKSAAVSEPQISVAVNGILAIDYNARIDRVKCQLSFRIDGAERTNVLALLEGKGPDRILLYFVQPDENNRLTVSW